MKEIEYWNVKLEKIQFALDYLKRIKVFSDIDVLIKYLESLETQVCHDLIEAEGQDEKL